MNNGEGGVNRGAFEQRVSRRSLEPFASRKIELELEAITCVTQCTSGTPRGFTVLAQCVRIVDAFAL